MSRLKTKKAFSLPELLISVALTAALLASVAVALNASFESFSENEDAAAITQTARSILNRMMREVRTADAIDTTNTQLTIIPSDQSGGLQQIQYEFANNEFYYRRTVNSNVTTSTLLASDEDVTINNFSILQEMGQDWEGTTCTRSITAKLVLTVDNKTFPVTASTSPRRNQLY